MQFLQIKENQFWKCYNTGLVVDISGKGEPQGESFRVAFRADIDALRMQEDNHDLPYRSKNNCAHMCGHDGHTTCLLGFASLILDNLEKIPSNKHIRLLFQPAEEFQGGALEMIKEGCLKGVDEVYGYHQWPMRENGKIGKICVKPGPFMADPYRFNVLFKGKGGHASEPHKCISPVDAAVYFHYHLYQALFEIQKTGKNFTYNFPKIIGGTAGNVIPDTAEVEGSCRILEVGLIDELKKIVQEKLEETNKKFGTTHVYTPQSEKYTLTYNSEKQAAIVIELANDFFGTQNVITEKQIPVYGSEDFSCFSREVPGVFYFLTSGREEAGNPFIHEPRFNFNDDLIDIASRFFYKIASHRLSFKE